jgi:hypothetical protein
MHATCIISLPSVPVRCHARKVFARNLAHTLTWARVLPVHLVATSDVATVPTEQSPALSLHCIGDVNVADWSRVRKHVEPHVTTSPTSYCVALRHCGLRLVAVCSTAGCHGNFTGDLSGC